MEQQNVVTKINDIEIFENYVRNLPYNKMLSNRARENRKLGILAEALFWKKVKSKNFYGIDFDRQRVIGNYIVDFYVRSLSLIIEIDGISHIGKELYDSKRQLFLENLGLRVYRISDKEVLRNIDKVISDLSEYIIENYSKK